MGEFGWAYIECSSSGGGGGGGQAAGPTGSVQFLTGSNATNGVSQLLFLTSSNTLVLTGTLDVSGTINANYMNINVTNKNVINLSASGDTKFGDTLDDTHQFTGSLNITGGIHYTYLNLTPVSYTASISDYIIGVTSSARVDIELPSASLGTKGRVLVFKDEYPYPSGRPTGSAIMINPAAGSSDMIEGNGVYDIAQGNMASISLYSNGNGCWFVF
jgi:hypothetical protein